MEGYGIMMAGNQLGHVSEKWNRALSAGMKILAVTLSVAALGAVGTLPASAAAERSLAGIKIFSRAKLVLQRFGNPSEIIPGGTGILAVAARLVRVPLVAWVVPGGAIPVVADCQDLVVVAHPAVLLVSLAVAAKWVAWAVLRA